MTKENEYVEHPSADVKVPTGYGKYKPTMDNPISEANVTPIECPACFEEIELAVTKDPINQMQDSCPECGERFSKQLINEVRNQEWPDEAEGS